MKYSEWYLEMKKVIRINKYWKKFYKLKEETK